MWLLLPPASESLLSSMLRDQGDLCEEKCCYSCLWCEIVEENKCRVVLFVKIVTLALDTWFLSRNRFVWHVCQYDSNGVAAF